MSGSCVSRRNDKEGEIGFCGEIWVLGFSWGLTLELVGAGKKERIVKENGVTIGLHCKGEMVLLVFLITIHED